MTFNTCLRVVSNILPPALRWIIPGKRAQLLISETTMTGNLD